MKGATVIDSVRTIFDDQPLFKNSGTNEGCHQMTPPNIGPHYTRFVLALNDGIRAAQQV